MELLDCLRRQAENNAWATFRLHRAVERLDPAAYRAQRTSFFPSIHLTLVHILFVDHFYLDAVEGGGRDPDLLWREMERFEREETFGRVAADQRASDRRLVRHVAGLDADALDDVVRLVRPDHVQVERRGDVLLHLFQHQIHHRGQVHAMLAGTDVEPPQLDEFFLAEELPLRAAELRALGLPQR